MSTLPIDPSMEALFVAAALQLGTPPLVPSTDVGLQHYMEVVEYFIQHDGFEPLNKVRKNFRELGGRLLDTDPHWFHTQLAGLYLKWVQENAPARG